MTQLTLTHLTMWIVLCLVHVMADFYLQPKSWVKSRNKYHYRSPALAYHSLVHTALVLVVLGIAALQHSSLSFVHAVFYSLIVGISHYLIDLAKSYAKPNIRNFLWDQVAHFVVLFVVWALATSQLKTVLALITSNNIGFEHCVIVLGYIIVLKPASVLIGLMLEPWTRVLDQVYFSVNEKQGAQGKHEQTLKFAGQRIGYLERVLILTFILLNQFAAIGFLLAAKSVFRFGDLRQEHDKKLTEYVMLGSLSSFTLTIIVGLIVSALVTQLPIGK